MPGVETSFASGTNLELWIATLSLLVALLLAPTQAWPMARDILAYHPRLRASCYQFYMNATFERRYFALLELLIRLGDRIYGEVPRNRKTPYFRYIVSYFSWRAFDRSLLIAIFYTSIFFFIGWLVGGSGKLGGLPVLGEQLPLSHRVATLAAFLATAGLIYWGFDKRDVIDTWFERRVSRSLPAIGARCLYRVGGTLILAIASYWFWSTWWVSLGLMVVSIISPATGVAVAAAAAVATIGAAIGNVDKAGAEVGAVVTTAFVAGVRTGTVSGILGVAGTGAIILGLLGISTVDMAMSIAFWVTFPVLNTVWDWISVGASRLLLAEILDRRQRDSAITHTVLFALIDIMLALLFLIALAVSLPIGVEVINVVLGINIDLRQQILEAVANPWRDGLWAGMMLIFTLVPTGLHLLVAIAGLVVPICRHGWREELLAKLALPDAKPDDMTVPVLNSLLVAVSSCAIAGATIWVVVWAINQLGAQGHVLTELLGNVAVGTIDLMRAWSGRV